MPETGLHFFFTGEQGWKWTKLFTQCVELAVCFVKIVIAVIDFCQWIHMKYTLCWFFNSLFNETLTHFLIVKG